MRPASSKRIWIIAAAAVLLAAAVLFICFRRRGEAPDRAEDVADGIRYLTELENADVSEVDRIREEIRLEKIEERREEVLASLNDDTADVWSLFEDFTIVGDSRVMGFSFYGYLPDDRIMADMGWQITNVPALLPYLEVQHPSDIYFEFGINDLYFYDTAEEYAETYADVLSQVKETLPDASLYVNSILLVNDHALSVRPYYAPLPEFNEALRAMCEEKGYVYIDNDDLCNANWDIYEPDGIHVQAWFYDDWAKNLIMAMYDNTGTFESEEATAGILSQDD